MIWTAPALEPDPDGPLAGDDRPILEGFLAWQRRTLGNLCAGLTGEQLAARAVPPSNLSLLGLIRHMAKVERIWFRQRMAAEPVGPMYDPEPGKDADFDDLDPQRADDDLARWTEECRRADAAVAGIDFGATITHRGEVYSLRAIYIHMIAEYARHNGHGDLLRERIDGSTGR
jgi:uncharacterized damage-inducible protein DinB